MDSCIRKLAEQENQLRTLIQQRGSGHKYVMDWVVRWTIEHGAEALQRFGWDGSPIYAGIGTLSLVDGKLKMCEAVGGTLSAGRTPANEEIKTARLAVCAVCPSFNGVKCSAGCSCNGSGRPEIEKSKCPIGKW